MEVAGEAARLLGGVAYPVEARAAHGEGGEREGEISRFVPVDKHLRQLEVRYPSVGVVVVAHFTVTGEHAFIEIYFHHIVIPVNRCPKKSKTDIIT